MTLVETTQVFSHLDTLVINENKSKNIQISLKTSFPFGKISDLQKLQIYRIKIIWVTLSGNSFINSWKNKLDEFFV